MSRGGFPLYSVGAAFPYHFPSLPAFPLPFLSFSCPLPRPPNSLPFIPFISSPSLFPFLYCNLLSSPPHISLLLKAKVWGPPWKHFQFLQSCMWVLKYFWPSNMVLFKVFRGKEMTSMISQMCFIIEVIHFNLNWRCLILCTSKLFKDSDIFNWLWKVYTQNQFSDMIFRKCWIKLIIISYTY